MSKPPPLGSALGCRHALLCAALLAGVAQAAPKPPAAAVQPAPASVAPAAAPDAAPVWAALQKAGIKDTEVAMLAQPLAEGAPLLVSHNEKLAFSLASTTKLVTTLAGLQTLPPGFRWRTRAWLSGTPVDGRLTGDLVLVGGGDATLDSARLQDWFKRLHAQGLRELTGHIVLDQSLYRLGDKDHANTPLPAPGNPHHARPDALVLGDSSFRVQLRQAEDGTLAARFDPPLGQVELVNRASGGGRCAAQASFEPVAHGTAPPAAPAPAPAPAASEPEPRLSPLVPVAARASEALAGARNAASAPTEAASASTEATPAITAAAPAVAPVARVVISGRWSPRCLNHVTLDAAPGRALTAALVAGAWEASGGLLGAPVIHRDAPSPTVRGARRARTHANPYPGKPWATLESPPLPELVRTINKDSHNLMARNLLLSMAPTSYSPSKSTLEQARERLGKWFQKIGLAQSAPSIDNGSGLAHAEQGSVLALVQLLQAAWADPKVQKVFLASLPVAGGDGTLAGRFKDSPAQRQAFLKTGTLTGVRALAGYVRGASGRTVAVAIVVNSERASAAVPALDKFIEWVRVNG